MPSGVIPEHWPSRACLARTAFLAALREDRRDLGEGERVAELDRDALLGTRPLDPHPRAPTKVALGLGGHGASNATSRQSPSPWGAQRRRPSTPWIANSD